MSAKKYSPAPWTLDPDCLFDDGLTATVLSADGTPIVEIFPSPLDSPSGQWTEVQMENARLIADAPRLKILVDLAEAIIRALADDEHEPYIYAPRIQATVTAWLAEYDGERRSTGDAQTEGGVANS